MLPTKSELRRKAQASVDPGRNPKHMAWVRRVFVCAAWKSGECEGPNHAHHVRTAANSGTGMKPDDLTVVPLCAAHHAALHNHGQKAFEERYVVDLMAEAQRLAKVSPYRNRSEPRPAITDEDYRTP